MRLLYRIGIWFYGVAIHLAAIFNTKAKAWVEGRRQQDFRVVPSGKRVIWFHCASLGEFDQGLPLMFEWRKAFPEDYILITFFSPSGMQHYHKREHPADEVIYLDLDTKRNAERFVKHYQPHTAFFIKYEFWHEHLRAAKLSGTKLYSVSTILRDDHVFFKSYGRFFRETLELFDFFYVQTARTGELLESIGINEFMVTGDSRFDKVLDNKAKVKTEPLLDAFTNDKEVWIIGSSWPIDEKVVLPVVNEIQIKVIIAPHQIDDAHIGAIENQLERPFVRFTHANADTIASKDVLILDTIGQLSNAYSYGTIAYVGGGFTGKLHNTLEPAVFGLPILIGPKHNRFPEAQLFIDHGIAFEVSDPASLNKSLLYALENRSEIRLKAERIVAENAGASQKIFQHINSSSAV